LPSADELKRLYHALERSSAINFAEYKPATIMRRVAHRQQSLGLATFDEYLARAESSEEEARKLADDLLINVTRFFRDGPAWDALERFVLPPLARGSGPLRVWAPACATGQEAYSLAMLLTEGLPGREFKVFASDVDAAALQTAAAGHYTPAELEGISPARRERFFIADDRGATVTRGRPAGGGPTARRRPAGRGRRATRRRRAAARRRARAGPSAPAPRPGWQAVAHPRHGEPGAPQDDDRRRHHRPRQVV
jgi:hypothetical protein